MDYNVMDEKQWTNMIFVSTQKGEGCQKCSADLAAAALRIAPLISIIKCQNSNEPVFP